MYGRFVQKAHNISKESPLPLSAKQKQRRVLQECGGNFQSHFEVSQVSRLLLIQIFNFLIFPNFSDT